MDRKKLSFRGFIRRKQMDSIYKKMRKMIEEDMDLAYDNEMSIISEDENHITIWDYYNDDIDRNYVKDRIILTKSASETIDLDVDSLCDYLCEHAKNTLINLEEIIFISDYDEDFEELYKRKDGYNWSDILETNDLPSDGMLGMMWFERSMVVINIGEILKATEEMAKNGEIYPKDVPEEFNIGIVTTLLHELRHLEQANPYIPAIEFDQISMDPETDAEEYARYCFDMYPVSILYDVDLDEEYGDY